ncbi:ABC transporter ATP-binding protein [Glycomyces algeriensis]|uniref:Cobalt ABC transporter ATP-binding protein n=1 Tax=Glycomyces algeriensis TaxID=256037 RepID=A0A9W6G6E6_9ACTN|nr:ATP-binding cassette domain-containing protein [Glycomyces algeriensis]MDA1367056.1 ATP-binding cassette domain-containing protein [Glycomyces algeriensis]MDR7348557.1 energy-coupling factor transport system ATP-binding protein [Glycomyces algeriensis]GLI41261.1 cobalt ABC transporter ATP-binding protein [Glycomyces algeriensis]
MNPGGIAFDRVTFTYTGRPVLDGVSFDLPEGEFCLLVGPTGAGKSTLLKAVNGLVPNFTGGTMTGRITVAGREVRGSTPADLADLVGYVGQDPLAGFVTDEVERELAYTAEQLGVDPAAMRKRVTEIVDLLGLADVRDRDLAALSSGQRQRVAIGAALVAGPAALVLDEPTSALDPTAADEVLSALHRLVHDLGVTVLLAEHRLERVAQYADSALLLNGGKVTAGPVGEVLGASPIAPPVVELGRLAGWPGPPVTIREARRHAAGLRESLAGHRPTPVVDAAPGRRKSAPTEAGPPLLEARGVRVEYPGGVRAVNGIDLVAGRCERIAVMGRNGSGKSSLLWALQGTGKRSGGTVAIGGADPAAHKPADRRTLAGLVPAEPADLLYAETVAAECEGADEDGRVPSGTCAKILADLVEGIDENAHPRDLSEGQRLALALAVTLTAAPPLLLLDEPTRGLDYPAKEALAARLGTLADAGHCVVVSTHDVEFCAEFASRVVILSDGEVVADGPARQIVAASPMFAPQVEKVLPGWLTVAEVAEALGRSGEGAADSGTSDDDGA